MLELATLICLLFIGYLFWTESRRENDNPISWAPFCWMFIAGSRFVSTWLDLRAPGGVEAYADGSPVDRAFFFTMIAWGSVVLHQRRIDWPRLFKQNKWLVAYLLYCVCSIAWTDEPFVLVKRWIKDLGNPIMVLILLTERQPYDAVATTIRRLSFVFLPLSVLFIKYYPGLGVGYAPGGAPMYTGVGEQKNALGLICLTTAICYTWTALHRRATVEGGREYYQVVMVAMLAWFLYMSNSQTSLVCVAVTVGILFISTRAVIARRPSLMIGIVLGGAIVYMGADAAFGVRNQILALLGRDSTLTNRTAIWEAVSGLHTNPMIGVGFMSFWAGDRLKSIAEALGGDGLNQAHNGYLEQYLNLGYVGVAFIIAIVITSIVEVRKQLRLEYSVAILRFCFIVAALLYNYTEASFYGINNMWVFLLAGTINPSAVRRTGIVSPWAATARASMLRREPQRQQPAAAPEPSERGPDVGNAQGSARSRASAMWVKAQQRKRTDVA